MAYKNWEIADFGYLNNSLLFKYSSPILYKNIFAIKVACPVARPSWRFGGWINIFALGSNFPETEGLIVQQAKLSLSSPLLVRLPVESGDYCRIEIHFPRWFPSAEVIIWQAEEDLSPETKIGFKLSEIDFQEIISKLDNLPNILLQ